METETNKYIPEEHGKKSDSSLLREMVRFIIFPKITHLEKVLIFICKVGTSWPNHQIMFMAAENTNRICPR